MNRQEFSTEHIETLRREFSRFETMGPEALPRFHAIFAQCSDYAIEQLAGADIKFLSKLALNEQTRRMLAA